MIEIWDTFQDVKIERYGEGASPSLWGGGIALPIRLGLGERCKHPQWGPGWNLGWKWIWCVLSPTELMSARQKRQNNQLHFDQLFDAWHILMFSRDKFGTGFGIQDNSMFRMTSQFFSGQASKFGTVPKNSGRMVTLNLPLKYLSEYSSTHLEYL